MEQLSMIENELVPIYTTSTGEKVVYGTELHRVLEVKSHYRDWVKNRLNDIGAIENEDFEGAEILAPSGQTARDSKGSYYLSGYCKGNGYAGKK